MSGSWNAEFSASAAAVRPKSQAMYFVLTRPMTREAMAEAIKRRVAVKAVWLCEGRRTESALCQRGVVEEDAMQDVLILQAQLKSGQRRAGQL